MHGILYYKHSNRTGIPLDLSDTFAVAFVNALWFMTTGKEFSLEDTEPREMYRIVKK